MGVKGSLSIFDEKVVFLSFFNANRFYALALTYTALRTSIRHSVLSYSTSFLFS